MNNERIIFGTATNKVELLISDILFSRLEAYGAIKWHKNKDHSFYIKFKDLRLGSIRISNHRGRSQYHYTYEIDRNDQDIERKIEDVVHSIIGKSKQIKNFNPNKYVIFDRINRCYKEVAGFEEYRSYVLGKTI